MFEQGFREYGPVKISLYLITYYIGNVMPTTSVLRNRSMVHNCDAVPAQSRCDDSKDQPRTPLGVSDAMASSDNRDATAGGASGDAPALRQSGDATRHLGTWEDSYQLLQESNLGTKSIEEWRISTINTLASLVSSKTPFPTRHEGQGTSEYHHAVEQYCSRHLGPTLDGSTAQGATTTFSQKITTLALSDMRNASTASADHNVTARLTATRFRLQNNSDQPPSTRPYDATTELANNDTPMHSCVSEHLPVQQDQDSTRAEGQSTTSKRSPHEREVFPTTTVIAPLLDVEVSANVYALQPLYNASDSLLIVASAPQHNIPQATTQLADKYLDEVEFKPPDMAPIPAARRSCYSDSSSLTTVSALRLSTERSASSPSTKGHRAEPNSEVKNFLAQLACSHEYQRILKRVDSTMRYPGNSSQKSSPVPKTILVTSSCTRATAMTCAKQDPSELQRLQGSDASLRHGCSSGPVKDSVTPSRRTELQDTGDANQLAFRQFRINEERRSTSRKSTPRSTNKHLEEIEDKLQVIVPVPAARPIRCPNITSSITTSTPQYSVKQLMSSLFPRNLIAELKHEAPTPSRSQDDLPIRQNDYTNSADSARDHRATDVTNSALYASRHRYPLTRKLEAHNGPTLKQQLELSSTARVQVSYLVQPFYSRIPASITTPIGITARCILDSAQWKACGNQLFDGRQLHEVPAKTSTAFITSLFTSPEFPPPSTNLTTSGQPVPSPKLAHVVAYALHRTRQASCVTFASLFLSTSFHLVKRFLHKEFLIRQSLTSKQGDYTAPSIATAAFRLQALQDNYDTAPQDASKVAKPTIHLEVPTYQHYLNMAELRNTNETSTTVPRQPYLANALR